MIDMDKLSEQDVAPEVDDWYIGALMVQDIIGCVPEMRVVYLARWAARLRERYVEIGRDLALEDYGADKGD